MSYAREYSAADAMKLINRSEHLGCAKAGLTKTKPIATITPRTVTGKVTAASIASVNVILDRFGAGELRLRTSVPSREASESDRECLPGRVLDVPGARLLARRQNESHEAPRSDEISASAP